MLGAPGPEEIPEDPDDMIDQLHQEMHRLKRWFRWERWLMEPRSFSPPDDEDLET